MYKRKMTETFNIILAILGVAISFGVFVDNSQAYPIILFTIMLILVFITRTRFAYLPFISLGVSIILYLLNFNFFNGLTLGYYFSNAIALPIAGVCALLFITYAVLNYMIMVGKIATRKVRQTQ